LNQRLYYWQKTKDVDGLQKDDRILIELLFLMGLSQDHIQKLQSRLKISNDTKKWLLKLVEINDLILTQKDFVSYCLTLDKSQDYLTLIHYFKALGLLDQSTFQKVIDTYKKFPISLVQAQDILHLVPAHTISKVLIEAREWQLKNSVVDRDKVIDHIRNKDNSQA
jgi:hypothetical protein